MTTTMRHSLATLALATALPVIVAAQAAPTRTLSKPDAEYSEPFSTIVGVRELKSGGVIVVDNRDKSIQLVDFKGTARKIGREGSGPGEFGFPTAVYAAPGDTTWVYDLLNSRYLVIDPSAKPVSTFMMDTPAAAPPGPGLGGGRARIGGIAGGNAQGIDAQGRLYFRRPKIRFPDEAPATVDTTPITRWDKRTNKTDTVGLLFAPAAPPAQVTNTGGGQQVRVSIGGNTVPFQSADGYAVTPAGDVAVVRALDYHLDWIVKGKTISGQPVPFEKIRVTEADKKEWIDSRKNAGGISMQNNNGVVTMSSGGPPPAGPPPQFPEFKGPFVSGSAVGAPNGQIWVSRHVPAGTPPTYDVFDNTGKVVTHVVLPQKTRLVGFGNGTVYLARVDDDDLLYLQRYRW
jgi:hypothetical protein